MRDHSLEPLYKVHYVSLNVALTLYPNYKKLFHWFTKQINLYQSIERIFYHLVLMVSGWWVKVLKIVEKLSGLYGSAIIALFILIKNLS